jgi:hypothetical protein
VRYRIALAVAVLSIAATAAAVTPPEDASDASGEAHPVADGRPQLAIEAERPNLRVLLSSIDMTVSLIDAYGQCREKGSTHEQCMAIIRETLDHARRMIGH